MRICLCFDSVCMWWIYEQHLVWVGVYWSRTDILQWYMIACIFGLYMGWLIIPVYCSGSGCVCGEVLVHKINIYTNWMNVIKYKKNLDENVVYCRGITEFWAARSLTNGTIALLANTSIPPPPYNDPSDFHILIPTLSMLCTYACLPSTLPLLRVDQSQS